MLTTRLPVATKMIIQIVADSWILRVACNTVDPYTLPASHHICFRINGIMKCDRNIKYSRAALGSNFEIRVVSDGPCVWGPQIPTKHHNSVQPPPPTH